MKFMLRVAFWLSVVIVLLPVDRSADKLQAPPVSAAEALSAAGAALSDMRQFCGRQPDACTIGSQALKLFGEKARNGASMLHTFLNGKLGADEGTVGLSHSSGPSPGVKAAHDTLLPADLTPPWRAPPARVPIPAKRPA